MAHRRARGQAADPNAGSRALHVRQPPHEVPTLARRLGATGRLDNARRIPTASDTCGGHQPHGVTGTRAGTCRESLAAIRRCCPRTGPEGKRGGAGRALRNGALQQLLIDTQRLRTGVLLRSTTPGPRRGRGRRSAPPHYGILTISREALEGLSEIIKKVRTAAAQQRLLGWVAQIQRQRGRSNDVAGTRGDE